MCPPEEEENNGSTPPKRANRAEPDPAATVIPPTVGRIVWFQTDYEKQPTAAIVTHVHNDRLVDLCLFDNTQGPMGAANVVLMQEGDANPGHPYAMWMPYQVGQAKRHQAEKKD